MERRKHEVVNEIKRNLGIMFYIQHTNLDQMTLGVYLKMCRMMKD